jgi:rhodanese-related sulfurtransferase
MAPTLTAVCIGLLFLLSVLWMRRTRDRRELEQHSITPEALHALLASNQKLLLFDVRQPLDLLAYPEIIPGAQRIPPQEVLERPSLIPNEQGVVIYCTCPSEKTSRAVLHKALALHFTQIRFLKGGLAGWKAKGYPVEPYRESFHLYAPSLAAASGRPE